MPGSHHLSPPRQDTSVLTNLSQISLHGGCFSPSGKCAKGKATSLEGKGVVNSQGKGVVSPQGKPQLSGMKEPEFQRQTRYCSRRGAPNTRLRVGRNLHSCTWGSLQAQPVLLCVVSCQLWFQGSSCREPSHTFIVPPPLLQHELTEKETTGRMERWK